MKFWKSIGKAVGDAANFVGEKSRKAAYLSRIRTVIQCEEKAAEKQYLALGRYYYNNLRDKANPVTESHCTELEAIEARLDKALSQLEKFYSGEGAEVCSEQMEAGVIGEEITLEDVESFDHDPTSLEIMTKVVSPEEAVSQEGDTPVQELEEVPASSPVQKEPASNSSPAVPEETVDLPFEG